MKKSNYFYLGIVFIFHLLIFFTFQPFFNFSDDLEYAESAYNILSGNFNLSSIASNRLIVTIPTAFFYWIGGINEYTTALFPLLCSLVSIFIVFLIGKQYNDKAGILAAFFVALNPVLVHQSFSLLPDVVMSTFILLCIYILYKVKDFDMKFHFLLGICFSTSLFFGLIAKETIVYILPFIGIVFLKDTLQKKYFNFWLATILTMVVLLFVYLLLYKIYFGDFFYRFNLSTNVSIEDWTDKRTESNALLKRLTIRTLKWLLNYAPFIILSIPVLIKNRFNHSLRDIVPFLSIYFFFFLVLLWFLPVSFKYYFPIPLYERYWMHIIYPLSILTSIFIVDIWNNQSDKYKLSFITIGLLLFFYINSNWYLRAYKVYFEIATIGFLILFLFLSEYFSQISIWFNRNRNYFISVMLVLVILGFYNFKRPYYINAFKYEKQALNILKEKENITVLTDERLANNFNYYWEFKQPTQNITFESWSEDTNMLDRSNETYILVNYPRATFFKSLNRIYIPSIIFDIPYEWDVIYQKNKNNQPVLGLYKLPKE